MLTDERRHDGGDVHQTDFGDVEVVGGLEIERQSGLLSRYDDSVPRMSIEGVQSCQKA